ncbi:MAG: L,D-transpeptidase family protein [Beijerinckiaceae bacterium]|nr:L,D-transpeptidase family protein [Beijerinckiaceae bacterium]
MPCVLGRSGIVVKKREGDGGTPYGDFAITGGYFRSDREKRPPTRVPLRKTRISDGWCDDPASFRYNAPVQLPTLIGTERLTLSDNVYDIVLTTDHNQRPRRLGAGSAIFVHFRRPDGGATEGCIAFAPKDLRRLLPRLGKRVRLIIR